MSHTYHDALPGFDPDNILTDGCEECEERSFSPLLGLTHLDHRNFRQAWADMIAVKWTGEDVDRNVSNCDLRLMNALYIVAVLLERHAGVDPRSLLVVIDAKTVALEAKLAAARVSS